jgi:signal transduction histidine kinase/ligand-binding sensor domain-containing protein
MDRVFALPDGSVWAAGGSSLFRLEGDRWASLNGRFGLGGGGVFSVLFDREGNIWIGRDERLAILRKGSQRFANLPNPVHYVSSIVQSKTGEVWLADAWRSVRPLSDDSPNGAFHLQGKAELLVDRDDNLWIAQDDEGLARIKNISTAGPGASVEVAGVDDLSARETHALLEDREGNIWLGTDRGLDRFKKTPFVPFRATELRFFPSLIAADDGSVWINSHGSSLMHVQNGTTIPVGLHVNTGPFAKRRNGDICFVDLTSYELQCYGASPKLEKLPDSMQHVPPKSLVEDVDGSLLLSTQGKGVWRYADGQWTPFKPSGASLGGPWTLYSDSSSRLWLGYGDNKVVVRTGDIYKTIKLTDELWSNTLVFAEGAGTVWAAGSNGLCYFDGESLRRVRTLDGNLLLGVSGIAFDRSGSMWLNGASGVLRIAPDEIVRLKSDSRHLVRVDVFDENDGLIGQPTQYKRAPSAIVDGHGVLWFATSGNVVSLDPTQLMARETLPSVLIENVLVDGKPLLQAPGSALHMPANKLHDLEINYIGIDLSAPERVNYRYRLASEDKTWQDAGARRQAFYTRLNPGTYRFQVSASNGGDWSELAVPLLIEVTPAFYQTWWFRILCVVALGGCVWLILRVRLHFIAEQLHSRMSERLSERERVARELHDGLLQGFQGLMMRFHLATQTIPTDTAARTEMEQALDRADDLLIESRDRIKDLRHQTLLPGSLYEALSELRADVQSDGIANFSLAEHGLTKDLNPASYQEIYSIAREAILNASKHSCCTEIDVSITFEASRLTVRIRDNGRGIPSAVIGSRGKSDHWGIAGMYERARNLKAEFQITSPENGGTSIRLAVPAAIAYRVPRKTSLNRVLSVG